MKLGTSIYQDRLDLNIRKHLSHDFFPFCFEKKAMNHFIIILVVFFFFIIPGCYNNLKNEVNNII